MRYVIGTAVVAVAAIGALAYVSMAAASSGSGKGVGTPTGVAVQTKMPSPAVESLTNGEVVAVAEQAIPQIEPFGYYGVCGVDGNLSSCPYTPGSDIPIFLAYLSYVST